MLVFLSWGSSLTIFDMPAMAASLEGFSALFPDPSLPEFESSDELADEPSSDGDFELEPVAEDGFAEGGFVEAAAALQPLPSAYKGILRDLHSFRWLDLSLCLPCCLFACCCACPAVLLSLGAFIAVMRGAHCRDGSELWFVLSAGDGTAPLSESGPLAGSVLLS